MVQMFPIFLALIPLFILFSRIGLINTYYSVIILYSVGQLPFATSMFRAFFDGIPKDLEEAAHIDGATRLQGFYLVVLPLRVRQLGSFFPTTNIHSAIFLRNEAYYTIPVGIQQFMQQYVTDWGNLMAAATLAMLPTFVLFLFVQKYMMYGAIGSGVKG